jgi:site-specific recombinase XerD
MPDAVSEMLQAAGLLRSQGPHAPNTVRRRLAHWATLHRWKGLESPLGTPAIRAAMRLAIRANPRPRQRKSKRAVTSDILQRLLATCRTDRPADTRDRALLLLAFASGGRRRSEIAKLRVEQLVHEAPVPSNPADPSSTPLPCLSITLGRTKTAGADDDSRVLLIGRPVEALHDWLDHAGLDRGSPGPVFRPVDRWDGIEDRPLTPQAVNLILKRRCTLAGLDPKDFSAHGIRSGYLTEAARRGIALPEAMQQSQHRSVQQAARYYNDAERALGKAARLAV